MADSAEARILARNDDAEYQNWSKIGHAVSVTLEAARPLAQLRMEQLQRRIFDPVDGELARLDPPIPIACDCGLQYEKKKRVPPNQGHGTPCVPKLLVYRAPRAGGGYTQGDPATAFYDRNPHNIQSAPITIDMVDQDTGAVLRASGQVDSNYLLT